MWGTFDRGGRNSFDAVHVAGAGRIAKMAAAEGVWPDGAHLCHRCGCGRPEPLCAKQGEGEAAVLAAFPSAMILRPSVLFGNEDAFFNRFAAMSRLGPILPSSVAGRCSSRLMWMTWPSLPFGGGG